MHGMNESVDSAFDTGRQFNLHNLRGEQFECANCRIERNDSLRVFVSEDDDAFAFW